MTSWQFGCGRDRGGCIFGGGRPYRGGGGFYQVIRSGWTRRNLYFGQKLNFFNFQYYIFLVPFCY